MSDEPRSGDGAGELPAADQPGETAPWERPRRWNSEALEPTKVDDLLARLGNPDASPRTRRRAADERADSISASDLIAALRGGPDDDQPPENTNETQTREDATTGVVATGSATPNYPLGPPTAPEPPVADQSAGPAGEPSADASGSDPDATTTYTATQADGDAPAAPEPAGADDPTTLIPVAVHDDPTVLLTHSAEFGAAAAAGTVDAGTVDSSAADSSAADSSGGVADGETAVIPKIRQTDDADTIRAQLAASSAAAGPAAAAASSRVDHGGKLFDRRTKRRVLVGGRALTSLVMVFVLGILGWNWKILEDGNTTITAHQVTVLQPSDSNIVVPSTKSSVLTTTNSAGQTVVTTKTSAAPVYQAENILMIGSDTRANGNGNAGNSDGNETTPQSDVIMLVHISADRQRVTALSIPRDTIIPGPTCKAWDSTTNTYSDQNIQHYDTFHINNTYSVGGPKCVVTAVQQLTGIKIDRFVGIDFNGFKDMVDALGGVTINICKPIDDVELGWITHQAGPQPFNGQQALNLVRARNVIGDNGLSDIARIRRQQGVLSTILRQLSTGNVLLNPTKLNNFIQAFAKDTFTQNVDINSLAQIASSLGDLTPGKVSFYTMPNVPDPNIDGAVDPEPGVAQAVFTAINNDNPLPGQTSTPKTTAKTTPKKTTAKTTKTTASSTTTVSSTPADLTLTIAPQNVALQIYNVTGEAGVATTAQQSLNNLGFAVTDNDLVRPDNEVQSEIEVRYSTGNRAAALTVAAAVPGAVLKLSDGLGSTVRLMLGSAYTGEVSAVSVGEQAPSSVDQAVAAGSAVDSGTTESTSSESSSSASSTTEPTTSTTRPTTTLNSTQVSAVNAGTSGCV